MGIVSQYGASFYHTCQVLSRGNLTISGAYASFFSVFFAMCTKEKRYFHGNCHRENIAPISKNVRQNPYGTGRPSRRYAAIFHCGAGNPPPTVTIVRLCVGDGSPVPPKWGNVRLRGGKPAPYGIGGDIICRGRPACRPCIFGTPHCVSYVPQNGKARKKPPDVKSGGFFIPKITGRRCRSC